jgi:hypothetical protein
VTDTVLSRRALGRAVLVVLLAGAGAGLAACSRTTADAAAGVGAPEIATPASITLETTAGTWASVPMGHLDQPLNTFWQLFYRPNASASWTNEVEATATATNGGLLLASPGGQHLDVGIRPSNDLTFSPLISTTDGGSSWSNGLVVPGLAARPFGLASDPSGLSLAVVDGHGGTEVMASEGDLSHWHALVSEGALASTPEGRSCGLGSITAVASVGADAVVGGSCGRPGVVGIFVERSGAWHLAGPSLPATSHGARAEVLGLQTSGGGISALVAIVEGGRTSVAAAWMGTDGRWSVSPLLRTTPTDTVTSFGPADGVGYFLLLTAPGGSEVLDVVDGPQLGWQQLPTPPAGTATVAIEPASPAAALVVDTSILTVWTLAPQADVWTKVQRIDVPIQYGSSG